MICNGKACLATTRVASNSYLTNYNIKNYRESKKRLVYGNIKTLQHDFDVALLLLQGKCFIPVI
ncbi:MAG: hypothetical protein A2W17_01335 [Planctomycetes bacterium RBG_16_41_13]|nr:MAG: hypothetical protein A2W17_01335 [Planctomycetes bacterium RBG_16_41_13]